MKSVYFLVGLLLPLSSLAAAKCECPLVKCGGTAAQVRGGISLILPFPANLSPDTLPPQWSNEFANADSKLPPFQICQCQNNAAISCYQRCGGPYPVLQVSQHLSFLTLNHRPVSTPKLTTSSPWSALSPPKLR